MTDGRNSLNVEHLEGWSRGLAGVIESFGDDSMPPQLADAIGQVVPFDYSAMFILRRDSAPIQIFDELPADAEPVKYIESPYLLDPVYDRFLKGTLLECCTLDDLCPDDFLESDYFLQYWSKINVVCEFEFNVAYDADTLLHLTVSRMDTSEVFSDAEKRLLSALFPVVSAILRRYWTSHKSSLARSNARADSFHRHLRFVMENFGRSMLTAREMDIMRLTMRGYSDKLSARELDITPGTVRNHKKSIFNKLRVSSQGQVFGLFLDVLQLPANEDIGPDPLATLFARRERTNSL